MKIKLIITLLFALTSASIHAKAPIGWVMANTNEYETGIDSSQKYNNRKSAFIESTVSEPESFTGLNQAIKADDYREHRIRLKGVIKTKEVAKWAGFWVRADDSSAKIVAFENMQNRGISGTTDWTPCEIVIDIPKSAKSIYFGLLLDGAGKVWMNDLSFEQVEESIPLTSDARTNLPNKPRNLDFKK